MPVSEKLEVLKSRIPKSIQTPNLLFNLQNGSQFTGYQKSNKSSYHVHVELKNVDLSQSFLCGYLKIKGLTDDWPDLCTFFEGEIIGEKHSFLTRKWEADESIDRQHWSQFPSFKPMEPFFNQDGFKHDFDSDDYIYMRWKEHFLVPDHRIKSISGASFAGFYYICFRKSTGVLSGIYFHHHSEWFQQLHLEHVNDRSYSTFEFR
ncbi:vacuolar import/degradation protein Vid24 [Globomyces pollinis-pini]|nr:vacuolar import/degradation protein Vid24 [Globomyces pollinis-pini]